MKAVVCRAFGPVEGLAYEAVERPVLPPGQVRVAVSVASLGFMDILMAKGEYQLRPDLPYVPGACGAGRIIELSAGVAGFQVGQRVSFLNYHGAFADEIVTPVESMVLLPDEVDDEQAATYRLTYSPAWFALKERGRLAEGETLLVTGGSGGVGLAAIRLGVLLGTTVIAAVGGEAKAQVARAAGATAVVTYGPDRPARLRDQVKELTDGRGVDVILEVVGGEVFNECMRCIAPLGRILVMGFASGTIPTVATNLALLKNCSIVGTFFGGWGIGKNFDEVGRLNQTLLDLARQGLVPADVTMRFPMSQVIPAMHALLGRRVTGKIILTPD